MTVEKNTRKLDKGIVRDFSSRMSYASYLQLPTLLSAQQPVSEPEHHDELLFIIQHQTTELWLKLVLHELRSAAERLRADDLGTALKGIARVKHIQKTLTEQWSVLATLTPTEYSEFRGFLGNSSGFQSSQYRAVEFVLGNKNKKMLPVFESDPEAHALLQEVLEAPSIYDEFLAYLKRQGFDVPDSVLNRDVTKAHEFAPELVPLFKHIYENASDNWGAYEACEELVDLEDNFQLWRFRHLRTVQRTIGMKSRHRRLQRCGVPAEGPRTDVLPGTVRRPDGDRPVTAPNRQATNPQETATTDALRQRAVELDAADPLARYRGLFIGTETDLSYLDGNSLGRPLKRTAADISTFIHGGLGRPPDPRLGRGMAGPAPGHRRPAGPCGPRGGSGARPSSPIPPRWSCTS